jgi:hypothetical protein
MTDPSSDVRHRFADWPNPDVPLVAAGVYAIWDDTGSLIYVAMSGRGIDGAAGKLRYGLVTRLASHASGRLSDQFCVYVANRLVVPQLTPDQLPQFASGDLRLDTLTKKYIHDHLLYSYRIVETAGEAFRLEVSCRKGEKFGSKPLLSPA